MKHTVTLESKEVRAMIAAFLGVALESVVPQRYGFAVADMSADEIEKKLQDAEENRLRRE